MVLWQSFSPPDHDRPSMSSLSTDRLFSIFDEYYRYNDSTQHICPVNYDHQESLRRRSIIAGLSLIRVNEYDSLCSSYLIV